MSTEILPTLDQGSRSLPSHDIEHPLSQSLPSARQVIESAHHTNVKDWETETFSLAPSTAPSSSPPSSSRPPSIFRRSDFRTSSISIFHVSSFSLSFPSLLSPFGLLHLYVFALFLFSNIGVSIAAQATNSQCDRIVTLTPAATELFWSLGFSEKLVGVSEHSDYPLEAKNKPNVGGYQKPNLEKILSLKPTLVVTPNEGAGQIQDQIKKLGLQTLTLSMRTFEEIPQEAERIIKFCKISATEEAPPNKNIKTPDAPSVQTPSYLISTWRSKINAFNSMKPNKEHFTFLIEVQAQPLMVAGSNTFLDQLFSNCGGKNLAPQKDYKILTLEKAYTLSPDFVFRVGMPSDQNIWVKHPNKKIKALTLDPDIYARPSPRLIDKLGGLCKELSL